MKKFLKTYALFISMLVGIIFHSLFVDISFVTKYFMEDPIKDITFLTKYMLFVMLLLVYCKVSIRQIQFKKWHIYLGLFQFISCLFIYFVLYNIDDSLASGALICLMAPTATSAPVITALLGGNVAGLITYSITTNLLIAIMAPLFLALVGAHGVSGETLTFAHAFWVIAKKVFPLVLGPFVLSIILAKFFPKVHLFLKQKQGISFWLWTIALVLLMSRTTTDLLGMDVSHRKGAVVIAAIALFTCLLQFFVGRYMGAKYHNKIASGQALGQKNTILAIWIAQTFFSPMVVVAPATYVVWQNLVNSFQLSIRNRRLLKAEDHKE